jgi:hypothetical protein
LPKNVGNPAEILSPWYSSSRRPPHSWSVVTSADGRFLTGLSALFGMTKFCEVYDPVRNESDFEQRYSRTRPYLYHLTDRSNLDHIRKTNNILPAARLMELAGRVDLLRARRSEHERLNIAQKSILIRDQAPLHEGNVELINGFSFEDLVESINRRSFFWPGTAAGPISYGVRHFERYQEERPVILQIAFQSLLDVIRGVDPLYCKYNSGSPRCSGGNKSPRGPDTFVSGARFNGTPSRVVEVTFSVPIVLPVDTKVGDHPAGPWRPFRP